VTGLIFGTDAFISLQSAVHAAAANGVSSDTVNIAAGTFVENVTINSQVNLMGTSGTIVDGNQAGRMFTIGNSAVTLDSLTIQNGSAFEGGGVFSAAILTINNSLIQNNLAIANGGGLYNNNGTAVIQAGSRIIGNSVSDFDSGGDAIFNHTGTVTIQGDSQIMGNSAQIAGGGIYNFLGTLTVAASTISNNSTSFDGGGIYNHRGTATVQDGSMIAGNSARVDGGGLYDGEGLLTVGDHLRHRPR
jgi:nitrous oxidase accessory protein NosD